MAEHKIADSSPALDPAPKRRSRNHHARATQVTQDDVPHHATERREPRRAALRLTGREPVLASQMTIAAKTFSSWTCGKPLRLSTSS